MSTGSPPSYRLPPDVMGRPRDILAIGSLVLEEVVQVDGWPQPGWQGNVRVERISRSAGGCAVNVACYAARLGARSAVVSPIGDGRYGAEVLAELARSGVDPQFLRHFPDRDGSLLIILSGPGGGWVTLDHGDPIVALAPGDLPVHAAFAATRIVHIDGYSFLTAGTPAVAAEALLRARRSGCVISVDGSVPAATEALPTLRGLFERADLVFANRFEALAVTGTATLDEAVVALRRMGPKVAVIKLGEEGSRVVTADGDAHLPAFGVDVVDTIAAGDAYVAAMLVELCRSAPLLDAAVFGSAAAALACTGAGSLGSRFGRADVAELIAGATA